MGLGNIGWSGMVLILVALLVVFGPSKLPEIGKAFGKSLLEFKSAAKGIVQDAIVDDSVQTETRVQTETSVSTPAMQSPVQAVVPIPVSQQSDASVSDQ